MILWEAKVNNIGGLKLYVFVGSMRWILSINTPSCEGPLWNLLNGLYTLTYTLCDNDRRYVLMCNFKNKKHPPHAGILISSRKKCKRNVLSWSRAPISSDAVSSHFFGGYRNANLAFIYTGIAFVIGNLTRFAAPSTMTTNLPWKASLPFAVFFFLHWRKRRGFFMVTYIPSIVLTQPAQRRTALTAT